MDDLISRKALLEFAHNHVGGTVDCNDIARFPAIEAEPVVRCKDCVCISMCNDTLVCARISGVMDGYYHGTIDVVNPDDYCSYGICRKAKPCDVKEE